MQRPTMPFGQGGPGLGQALRQFGAATRTAQAIGLEWLDYAKQSGDDLAAVMGRLAAARTPSDAFAIQAAFLRGACDRATQRAAVLGDLYLRLAADLAHPGSGLAPTRPS